MSPQNENARRRCNGRRADISNPTTEKPMNVLQATKESGCAEVVLNLQIPLASLEAMTAEEADALHHVAVILNETACAFSCQPRFEAANGDRNAAGQLLDELAIHLGKVADVARDGFMLAVYRESLAEEAA